jgi:Tfp pilus assembly protein PilO
VRKSKRQVVNRIFEVAAVILVALDVVAFFAFYRRLAVGGNEDARRAEGLRQTLRMEQVRVDWLKKYEAALPETGKGLDDFAASRVPSRREGYSTSAHVIYKAADAAGVKVSTLAFREEKGQHDPLERLSVEINAQGPYGGLLKFSHALETADVFMLVRDFTIAPGGENGAIGLRLDADVYLTP